MNQGSEPWAGLRFSSGDDCQRRVLAGLDD
jgi:hypothetical protein